MTTYLRKITLFFTVLCFLQYVFADESSFKKEKDVLVLEQSNFEEALETFDTLLVEFYAPWCGHCKQLEPEYAKAAGVLKQNNPPIYIAKVDATTNKDLAGKYQVRGYPTLKLFKNGNVVDYDRGRTSNEIITYMKNKAGPLAAHLQSRQEAEDFASQHKIIAVALLNDQNSKVIKMFENVGFSIDAAKFAYSVDPAVKRHFDVPEGAEAIVILKKVEGERSEYILTESTTQDDISVFVAGNVVPLVEEFSQASAKKIFDSIVKTHVLVFADKSKSSFNDLERTLTEVARQFKGKMKHVVVPSTETRIFEFFGVQGKTLPVAAIADMRTDNIIKYLLDKDVTVQNLAEFESAFLEGSLKPFFKSEKSSPKDDAENVKVIVGETFFEKVINNKKDVLLEFYAPWCGHCKSLAPEYEKLGAKFASADDIVIAKIDATTNEVDHPMVNVRGFPTIIFFPGNAKDEPQVYSGDRKVGPMVDFLREHATHTFTVDGVQGGKAHDEF